MRGIIGAWVNMMPGHNGWLFRIQIGLLGAVFYLGNLYMALRIRRANPGLRVLTWMRVSLWLLVAFTGLAVLPKDVPLGQMIPWKFTALGGFVLLTAINMVTYARARRRLVWGRSTWQAHATLGGIGVLIVALFVIMGIIRESARGSYLIYNQMGPEQSQQLVKP